MTSVKNWLGCPVLINATVHLIQIFGTLEQTNRWTEVANLKRKAKQTSTFQCALKHSRQCEIENDIFVHAEKGVFCRQMLINK